MMDLKKVKEVIELMQENDLVEVELVDGESKIHLKRPQAGMPVFQPMQMPMTMTAGSGAAPAALLRLQRIRDWLKSSLLSWEPFTRPPVRMLSRMSKMGQRWSLILWFVSLKR